MDSSEASKQATTWLSRMGTRARKKVDAALDSISDSLNAVHDQAVLKVVERALTSLGPAVLKKSRDPWMPYPIYYRISKLYYAVWSRVHDELLDSTMESFGRVNDSTLDKDLQKLRLKCRALAPRMWIFDRPGVSHKQAFLHLCKALRARFLYAEQPADGTIWRVLRTPLGLTIAVLKFASTPISVACFALLFILMDKSDEHQLVRFILKFKTIMLVTAGLYPAVKLGISYHACLEAIQNGVARQCVENAASSSAWFPLSFAAEIVRILLIAIAYYLLASGYAVGGKEAVYALEEARLDAADGDIDGQVDVSDLVGVSFVPMSRFVGDQEYHEKVAAYRVKHRARVHRGGALTTFLLCDMAVLALLVCLWLYYHVHFYGVVLSDPILWSSLYNLKLLYGFCSFPYMIFEVPVLSNVLMKTTPTAYNQRGRLVPKLTKSEVQVIFADVRAAEIIQRTWRSYRSRRALAWRQKAAENAGASQRKGYEQLDA